TRPEPALPRAKGWPFAESFPRTSGTGRLGGGASYWSDFLYDDHGAVTDPLTAQGNAIASLAPTDGGYSYPAGKALMNGADVFRNAVGLDAAASYWRVDWNTLADPAVPVAVWGLDTNASTQDGVREWPAGAGVRSPGLDRALVVSSRGAWLVDARTGRRTDVSSGLTVDRAARSFVVRVPRATLPVSGTWRLRLAAGLANADGDGLAPATGASDGGTAVYNVSYRSVDTEPQQYKHGTALNQVGTTSSVRAADMGNYWMEDHQAEALAQHDVSAFAQDLRWSDLRARAATPEPLVTGWSNRWFVSSLDLGQGVIENAPGGTGDLRPNYLGRVQPYGVYVPTTYRPGTPMPLTWMLHSLSVQHNQYGALDPNQVRQTCEDRQSICATTLGRGPDMWYFDEAETDFWEVWNRLAHTYTLDPERTVISGYSMGGYGSYKLGLAHPDLFAKAMALAGPPTCGIRVVGDVRTPANEGRCTTEGDTKPLIGNAHDLQYVIASGVLDELVPFPSVLEQVGRFDELGYRYHAEYYPGEGHIPYAAKDAFEVPTRQLGRTVRAKAPAAIDHTWYPHLDRPELGIGTTGAYWVRDLTARSTAPGTLARVTARSRALPDAVITVHKATRTDVPGDPSPALVTDQTWQRHGFAPRSDALTLGLTGVRSLTVDAARAALGRAARVALDVTTDGRSTVTFLGMRPGAVVAVQGAGTRTADSSGAVQLVVGG
ncbi:MAG: Alpha/beta hydrolase family protein, partial [Frankiales bacterium]|nr:Alpha/beta hydrolase family protein [Frankiales bacterium]